MRDFQKLRVKFYNLGYEQGKSNLPHEYPYILNAVNLRDAKYLKLYFDKGYKIGKAEIPKQHWLLRILRLFK